MSTQTTTDQVTISARLHVLDVMQVAWPNPVQPLGLRTQQVPIYREVTTYRQGDDPRTLEFSLEQLKTVCRTQAAQYPQVTIAINLVPLPQVEIVRCCQKRTIVSNVEQGAQLVVTFGPGRDDDSLVKEEAALEFANQLIDALHKRELM